MIVPIPRLTVEERTSTLEAWELCPHAGSRAPKKILEQTSSFQKSSLSRERGYHASVFVDTLVERGLFWTGLVEKTLPRAPPPPHPCVPRFAWNRREDAPSKRHP